MGSPFTITSVANYNSNPPSDDGAQTAANRVQWSTQKTKLSDPIKTAFDTSETATSTAFGKVLGGGGITTTAVDYTVTASDQGKLVKCTVAGKTITTPDATVVGSPFVFGVLNASSGDITFDGSGTQTVDGDLSFTIPAGCGLLLNTDGTNWFTFGRDFNNVLQRPQGYLTLTTGTPVITADVTSVSSVFYTPFEGDRIPISTDGVTFKMRQFTELTLALVSNHLLNTIYDIFLFDNPSSPGQNIIGTGPAWTNSGGGTGARGTGAGTTELQKVHGLWTNKNSMTARNGSTTYTVPANEGTYVGSIYIDGVAGQVSNYISFGQSRKWGVWNAYNRQPINMQCGDSTSQWTPPSLSTIRASNGNTNNKITIFSGLPEETVKADFSQFLQSQASSSSNTPAIGIGLNSTTVFSGLEAQLGNNNSTTTSTIGATVTAKLLVAPFIGINVLQQLEEAQGAAAISNIFNGGSSNMNMSAAWRG
jgi:hypothetical protein